MLPNFFRNKYVSLNLNFGSYDTKMSRIRNTGRIKRITLDKTPLILYETLSQPYYVATFQLLLYVTGHEGRRGDQVRHWGGAAGGRDDRDAQGPVDLQEDLRQEAEQGRQSGQGFGHGRRHPG